MDRTEVTKMPGYYLLCLFTISKSLVCLALQTETIVKKITQPKLQKTKNKYVMSQDIKVSNFINQPISSNMFNLLDELKPNTSN